VTPFQISICHFVLHIQLFLFIFLRLNSFHLQANKHILNSVHFTINHLTPSGHYMGRTAQLTSRCFILYIYSTNKRTEYFKHAA